MTIKTCFRNLSISINEGIKNAIYSDTWKLSFNTFDLVYIQDLLVFYQDIISPKVGSLSSLIPYKHLAVKLACLFTKIF